MKTVTLNGNTYPVIGEVESEVAGGYVPLLDIKLMSDERWMELTNTPENRAKAKLFAGKELHNE